MSARQQEVKGELSKKGKSSSNERLSLYVIKKERKNKYGEDGNVLSVDSSAKETKTKGEISFVTWSRQKKQNKTN